ncbi:dihydropteroate synthase [candidate division NPL-UPA2 bacterium Unc8]|uniref:Dihydropteroate synthase n=1 Tax=candidate division NPL-UPA2 bacterium Unc8 TaxID=1980939 RepID=A0A399FVM7_UNCN2|nr:5-methyltetrahydrofolate:corrinoid/iron-sulfur protein co-methyltransferase [Bacillota bacterium]MBT9146372.1 5-methyltetrahydrofolate:corrinoid/iron-sulfur protein co-methyltransferase [Bacillota bacterium]RII00181.1 MAG: dihydropteroate synthase [candidate division NPL-UPA2 bacterium Unc8]
MILIGENINIMVKVISKALEERNPEPIQKLAIAQTEAGVDFLDLNLGPARKDGEAQMEWLVRTVQEASTLPLSLDTTNPVAMEAGLAICRDKALINSASGKQESIEKMLPLAQKYSAGVIISVLNDEGIPSDAAGRAESIMETISTANELGISNEDIWVDPILLPVSVDQQQVVEYMEFVKMLADLAPGVKSTVGLSNLSNGTPGELRGILNRTYMIMIGRCGQYSAIVDAFDKELISINKGEMTGITELVHKVMDGEDIDTASLSSKERDYVKTAAVIMGKVLYSHSWLELD